MKEKEGLPQEFVERLRALEPAYLQSDDPIRQSGFGGGAIRWRQEREPILDAITAAGDLLDIGCANGYLLECLCDWAKDRGIALTPYGVDLGEGLIALARERFPEYAGSFFVANAWDWEPPRRFRYVYTLYDCVPESFLAEYVRRLLDRVAAPGGRLTVGAYGSRSRQILPLDVGTFLTEAGFTVSGQSQGGDPLMTRFAWIDKGMNE